jgi:hypothetical protein
MLQSNLIIGRLQALTGLPKPFFHLFLQTMLLRGGLSGLLQDKIPVFRGNAAPPRMFLVIQAFVRSDAADPGLFISAVEKGGFFIGGQKSFLGQILRCEIIGGNPETNGKNQVLIPVNQKLQLFFPVDKNPPPLRFSILYNDSASSKSSNFKKVYWNSYRSPSVHAGGKYANAHAQGKRTIKTAESFLFPILRFSSDFFHLCP